MKDPSLRRSVALFRAFRDEQTDPDSFYSFLADDAVAQVERYLPVVGEIVADVGGGGGHFTEAFRARGARSVLLEPDLAAITSRANGRPLYAARADGYHLPLADAVAGVCFSSNVLEHVPEPYRFIDEMVRVTRPGGIVYLSFTNWLSPWGGHETAPWHYLGAERARRRYQARNGRPAKHTVGDNLFKLRIAPVVTHVRARPDVTVEAARSRYWPFWAEAVTRLPGLREVITWNMLLVLRRR